MMMQKLGDIEVQYITCYLTSRQQALSADRRRSMNPIMGVYSDPAEETLVLRVKNLQVESMRSTGVKEGLDLYIIKPEAQKLKNLLVPIIGPISSQIHLDRTLRSSKDPRPTYVNSGGLPIPIQMLSVPVKINHIIANYFSVGYKAEIIRSTPVADEPTIKLDAEDKQYWDRPRMHIGIHEDWTVQTQLDSNNDEITIVIPWEELGHLLGSIVTAESGLSK